MVERVTTSIVVRESMLSLIGYAGTRVSATVKLNFVDITKVSRIEPEACVQILEDPSCH